MADRVDTATRSRIMRAIKSKDTTPERQLKQALIKLQLPGWVHGGRLMKLPGSPDFVFANAKLAVFVHGCYWHLCPRHYKPPSGAAWRKKMDANRRRDIRVRRKLRALGWATLVVWEHEDATRAAARIQRRLETMQQLAEVRQRLHGRECPEYGGRCNSAGCVTHCEKEIPF